LCDSGPTDLYVHWYKVATGDLQEFAQFGKSLRIDDN
jgi:hypothetical protein